MVVNNKSGRPRHSLEYIKEAYRREGYTYLGETHTRIDNKERIMCSQGHTYKKRYSDFHQGRRCKECYDQSNRERIIKEIEKELEGSGYIRISTETYKDNKKSTTHILECSRGHKVKIHQSYQYRETYCNVCKVIERLEDMKTYLARYGFTYKEKDSTYIDNRKTSNSKIQIHCRYGHIQERTFGNFKSAKVKCWDCRREGLDT